MERLTLKSKSNTITMYHKLETKIANIFHDTNLNLKGVRAGEDKRKRANVREWLSEWERKERMSKTMRAKCERENRWMCSVLVFEVVPFLTAVHGVVHSSLLSSLIEDATCYIWSIRHITGRMSGRCIFFTFFFFFFKKTYLFQPNTYSDRSA